MGVSGFVFGVFLSLTLPVLKLGVLVLHRRKIDKEDTAARQEALWVQVFFQHGVQQRLVWEFERET